MNNIKTDEIVVYQTVWLKDLGKKALCILEDGNPLPPPDNILII